METDQQKFASTPVPAPEAPGGAASKTPAVADLSAEIAATVERQPGDRVRVTWVSGANYRCNWWAPGCNANYDNPGMAGLIVTTHVVRKSQFLSVTKVGGGLLIKDRSGVPSAAG